MDKDLQIELLKKDVSFKDKKIDKVEKIFTSRGFTNIEQMATMFDYYKSRIDKAIEQLKTANVDIDSVRLCEVIQYAEFILKGEKMTTQFDEILLQDLDNFINYYEFIDVEKVYTNGSKLIQVSRIKQWFDYNNEKQKELEEENKKIKSRIDKAIEFIKENADYSGISFCSDLRYDECLELLEILKGE